MSPDGDGGHSPPYRASGRRVLGLAAVLSVAAFVSWRACDRTPPLSWIDRESAIRAAAKAAIEDICRSETKAQSERGRRYLIALCRRLESGWPGLVIDGYHPAGYDEGDLLLGVYTELGVRYLSRTCGRPDTMLELLMELEPAAPEMRALWERGFELVGLPLPESSP